MVRLSSSWPSRSWNRTHSRFTLPPGCTPNSIYTELDSTACAVGPEKLTPRDQPRTVCRSLCLTRSLRAHPATASPYYGDRSYPISTQCPSRHRGIDTRSGDPVGNPIQAAEEFALVASRGRGAGGTPVSGAAGLDVLVELAGEMQPFEDELERGGHARRIRRAELLRRGVERGHAVDLLHVLLGRHRIGHGDREPALERCHHLVELAPAEAPGEDVEHRALGELAEHLVLAAIADRLELDLAARRGDDGAEVAHPWRRRLLAQPDRPLERARQEVLVVADRDAHRDAGALADLRRLPGEMGQLGDDLLHVARRDSLKAVGRKARPLRLHDRDLVLEPLRVVRADL